MTYLYEMVTRVDDQFLIDLIKSGKEYYVLDARDDDRAGGHIPGSIHVADSMESSTKTLKFTKIS